MSHTAHIPSHRKPRRSATKQALRAGVAGGVLSTLAVAAAAGTATAAEPVTETIEMPTLTTDLSTQIAQSADATQQTADSYELRAEQDAAAVKAAKQAKEDQAAAKKKAEAKAKAEAAAKKKAEEERASRSSERTTLSAAGSSASTADAPAPASGSVGSVIGFLKAQLGDAYVMGASGPNAWDCSSLVQAAFKQAGVDLPRVSQDQSVSGTPVSLDNVQVGDILYWGGAGSAYHVGVYIGNGQYLDAANPGKGVVIQDLSGYPADGAVRVL
ncbi:C40 family peptidase [Streptomyces sp. NPDC056486]|uniref:C40 family peptidase n=1 Tax=Streptomyces sp. NPDC056486 TaxID=3345835 RepID=UPI00369B79D2